jgi:hypothetical protein
MKNGLIAGAAMLVLSAGSAFAMNPGSATADPAQAYSQAPAPYGAGGYVFPDEGSPSGDIGTSVTEPQQPSSGRFGLSHVYLYPPAQDGGAD